MSFVTERPLLVVRHSSFANFPARRTSIWYWNRQPQTMAHFRSNRRCLYRILVDIQGSWVVVGLTCDDERLSCG